MSRQKGEIKQEIEASDIVKVDENKEGYDREDRVTPKVLLIN